MKLFNRFIICLFVFVYNIGVSAQSFPTDTNKAEFVYDDIQNFIRAYQMLDEKSDTANILQSEYIDNGSPGLKAFIDKYGLSSKTLAKKIQKYPKDYEALGKKLDWLISQEDSIKMSFRKLNQFIPDAIFPPTYYLVGMQRGICSASEVGQLITIEKYARKVVDKSQRTYLVHELVHMNQVMVIGLDKYRAIYGEEKSLLALTIREGVAEFFTEMVTGSYTQEQARKFVVENEAKLWEKFQNEMFDSETEDWMWSLPSDPEQPQNIGYVLGAMIVEFYYKHSMDAVEAIKNILSITDYEVFIKEVNYSQKIRR